MNVETDRDRIYIGESFILQAKVSGSSSSDQPDVSGIKGCDIRFLGSQDISRSSIMIINGKVTRESFSGRVFNYQVTPQSPGEFSAGPVSINDAGRVISESGPRIFVVDVEKQDRVLVSIEASRAQALLDEQFDVTLRIGILALAPPHSGIQPLFPSMPPVITAPYLNPDPIPGLQNPPAAETLSKYLARDPGQPGFQINEYETESGSDPFGRFGFGGFFAERVKAKFALDHSVTEHNGKPYFEYSISLRYTAMEEGNYTFGPALFKGKIPVRVDETGTAEAADIFAVGPACTVRIVPPPEQGRPDTFVGTLGSNLFASASLDATECKAGDPLRLTLTIGGDVRLDKIVPPRLSEVEEIADNFIVYDETVQTSRKPGFNEYLYTVRPLAPGDIALPPISVSYYDTSERDYKTVRTAPAPIKVLETAQVTSSHVLGAAPAPPDQPRAGESAPAPFKPFPTGGAGSDLQPPAWALLIAAASPFVFAFSLLPGFLSERKRKNAGLLRKRRAMASAMSALTRLERDTPSAAEAAGRLCSILRSYVADVSGAAAAGITPEDAEKLLTASGADTALARDFSNLFSAVFCAEYSLSRDHAELDIRGGILAAESLLKKLNVAVRQNEKKQKKHPPFGLAILILLAASTCLCRNSSAGNDIETDFLLEEAKAALATAKTIEDFRRAADIMRNLAARGERNGILFYNLGTALLRAGQKQEAMPAFLRAERRLGADPDLRLNMRIAADIEDNENDYLAVWRRVFLFWHYALPCRVRSTIALTAFALFWAALTAAGIRGQRNLWLRTAKIAALASIIFGASATTSALQEQRDATRATPFVVDRDAAISSTNHALVQ